MVVDFKQHHFVIYNFIDNTERQLLQRTKLDFGFCQTWLNCTICAEYC